MRYVCLVSLGWEIGSNSCPLQTYTSHLTARGSQRRRAGTSLMALRRKAMIYLLYYCTMMHSVLIALCRNQYSNPPPQKKGWLSSNIVRPPSVLISLPLNPSAFSDRCIPFSQRYTSSPNCRVTCVRLLRTSALFTCFYKHISGVIPFTSAILHHHGCYSSKSLRSPRNEYGLEEQADVLSPSTRE